MMNKEKSYLTGSPESNVHCIIKGIDKDVERGEDILMMGLGSVMMSTFFAPIAPPSVLLPLVALTFVISSVVARIHYHKMKHKLQLSMEQINTRDQTILKPIAKVFDEHPPEDLSHSFNPLKNLKRTLKSAIGGILINPFWMPIFYMMGVQIGEEKNLNFLNFAIMGVEKKIAPKVIEN
jgi:hypothetical protein